MRSLHSFERPIGRLLTEEVLYGGGGAAVVAGEDRRGPGGTCS